MALLVGAAFKLWQSVVLLPSVMADKSSTLATETAKAATPSTVLPSTQATPAEIIRLEANFLQFPFFALDTHGLKELDGLSCTAERLIGDERHEVTVRITRNNAYAFPGPLSRKIHFALLAKLQDEQPYPPYRNPITWSWYDLAERIGLKQCSGRDIRQMKEAIESTLAAFIKTRYSLRHTEDSANSLRKRDSGYHLYERTVFAEEPLPDGTVADTNHLWLSEWYLANLNSHYCGPLDYGRWLFLNNESRIASRLYEYLSYNFSAGMPRFKIRYDRLAQFLPVTICRSLSRVRQQLEPALKLLQRQQVIDQFRFEHGKSGDLLLVFEAGSALRSGLNNRHRLEPDDRPNRDPNPANASFKESKNDAANLVRAFYDRWAEATDVSPSEKELALASEQLTRYGTTTTELLPLVVKLMRQHFPDAQHFGATRTYWSQSATLHTKKNARNDDVHKRTEAVQQEERVRQEQQAKKKRLRQLWQSLELDEQQRIASIVNSQADSEHVRRAINLGNLTDPLVELACLKQLEAEGGRT